MSLGQYLIISAASVATPLAFLYLYEKLYSIYYDREEKKNNEKERGDSN